jgi:AraC-like DNA-binding protein
MNAYTFRSDDLGAEFSNEARFRLSYDMLSAEYGPFVFARTDNKPFVARSEFRSFGPVKTIRTNSTLQTIGRRPEHMSASRLPGDAFDIQLNDSASRFSEFQRGRETVLEPGSGGLFTLSEPGEIRAERDGALDRHCYLIIPRLRLCELVPDAEKRLGAILDPASPAIRHLRSYLQFLSGSDDLGRDPALAEHIATTILDLVVLSLGAKGDAAAVAHTRGLRAARVQELLHQIRIGFTNPSISPEQVARKLGLSPRYLQQLLQETGSTFTERVLELRLQRARQMLVQRGNRQLKIIDIAYACGFNELSYFNRCFRRRFGDTPSGYRGSRDADG